MEKIAEALHTKASSEVTLAEGESLKQERWAPPEPFFRIYTIRWTFGHSWGVQVHTNLEKTHKFMVTL